MTRILIPRSDNVSAKIIEASDWEKYWSDIIPDYITCGFTLSAQCPNILAVDVSSGTLRLKGLHVNNSTTCSVTSLTACATNYIYATICRDPTCEPQGWIFSKNTTGTTPTDSVVLGTVTTNATTVTAVSQIPETCLTSGITGLKTTHGLADKNLGLFGDGIDGDVTISTNTTLTETKYYKNLTINACVTLDGTSPQQIFVKETLTVNGTLSMSGNGGNGGVGSGVAGGVALNLNNTGGVGADANAAGTGGSGGSAGASNGGAGTAGTINAGGGGGGSSGTQCGGVGCGGSSGTTNSGCGGTGGTADTESRNTHNLLTHLACSPTNTIGAGGGSGVAGGVGGSGGPGPTYFIYAAGPGGAGGAGGAGGTGGHGGGYLIIIANNIVIGAAGSIESDGGTGSTGGAGGTGGGRPGTCAQEHPSIPGRFLAGGGGGGGGGGIGSGGGGGAGGFIFLHYVNLTNNGSISVAGGTGGSEGTTGGSGGQGGRGGGYYYYTGGDGGSGGPGDGLGTTGTAGTSGLIIKIPA
jgi:hypothetical protein